MSLSVLWFQVDMRDRVPAQRPGVPADTRVKTRRT